MFAHQHPITVSYLLLANLYGPGQQECRVVPSLMRKVPRGEVLRGTGQGSREFLYVAVAAWALEAALRARYDGALNVGTGVETSIRDLASMFGDPRFDGDASADSRMVMQVGDAEERIGWHATTTLRDGIEWCKSASASHSGAGL
jgi:UDP-glucose 4-epimerase